jgi:bacterioferritin-associated ferredoxin
MFVCMCMAVTECQIRACLRDGASSVEEVGERCGAGTGCGGCVETVELLVEGGSILHPATTHHDLLPRSA